MVKHIIDDIKNNLSIKIKEKYIIASLAELGGYQNYIYEFNINNDVYILRVTHSDHRSKLEIEEEIKFLNLLYSKGVPVARHIKLDGYNKVEELKTKNNTYFISIFQKARGKEWRETNIGDDIVFNAGKTLGKIHRVASQIKTKFNRLSWDKNQYINIAHKVIPDEEILKKLENFRGNLMKIRRPKEAYGLVHGDYQFGNMIYNGKDITVFDFDELEYNWFAYDIAVYLFYFLLGGDPGNMDLEPNIKLFKNFMRGYLEEKDIDIYWIEKLQDFLRLREYILLSSIYRSYYPDNLNPWTEAFIKAASYRIKNDIKFIDIDYVKLFKELEG